MRPRTGIAAFVTVLSAAGVLGATTLPAGESFRTVVPAAYDQVVRGVSVTRARTTTTASSAPRAR